MKEHDYAYRNLRFYFKWWLKKQDEFKELSFDVIQEIFEQLLEHAQHVARVYVMNDENE